MPLHNVTLSASHWSHLGQTVYLAVTAQLWYQLSFFCPSRLYSKNISPTRRCMGCESCRPKPPLLEFNLGQFQSPSAAAALIEQLCWVCDLISGVLKEAVSIPPNKGEKSWTLMIVFHTARLCGGGSAAGHTPLQAAKLLICHTHSPHNGVCEDLKIKKNIHVC